MLNHLKLTNFTGFIISLYKFGTFPNRAEFDQIIEF